jgi:hypothetical protein
MMISGETVRIFLTYDPFQGASQQKKIPKKTAGPGDFIFGNGGLWGLRIW